MIAAQRVRNLAMIELGTWRRRRVAAGAHWGRYRWFPQAWWMGSLPDGFRGVKAGWGRAALILVWAECDADGCGCGMYQPKEEGGEMMTEPSQVTRPVMRRDPERGYAFFDPKTGEKVEPADEDVWYTRRSALVRRKEITEALAAGGGACREG